MSFRPRKQRLQQAMKGARVDALVVNHLPDVRYLCGFTGSNGVLAVLATSRGVIARLFTDGRYTEQAKVEVSGATVRVVKGSALSHAVTYVSGSSAQRCGFDPSALTVQSLSQMKEAVKIDASKTRRSTGFLVPVASLVSTLRQVKDQDELAILRRAALLSCELYEGMLGWIEPGMREIDVAAELEHRARRAGAEAMSFETIAASGVRSSMPHARATTALLEAGRLLTLDFGVILDGYCSDMTRTISLGAPAKSSQRKAYLEQQQVFAAVLEAQQSAVAAVREGVTMAAVDEAARSVLRSAGLARYFTHSTGHGIGLEVHEPPRLAKGQNEMLLAGMVITVEPGVYLPGRFGVRIEDSVAVTENGCEILTPAHRGWVEL